MHHDLMGPVLGNVIIIAVGGVITVICFVLMFRLLLRPGETDRHHPKRDILREDQ